MTGAIAIAYCFRNSIYKFATIGETGLALAVPNVCRYLFSTEREISCSKHKFKEIHNIRDQ